MIITKHDAIENHRKMWRWISDYCNKIQINGFYKSVESIKDLYFQTHGFNYEEVDNFCFCCKYAHQRLNDDCSCVTRLCPVVWDEEETWQYGCERNGALYTQFVIACKFGNYIRAAEVASQIAELPEREDCSDGELEEILRNYY